jgi:hypothetical protein
MRHKKVLTIFDNTFKLPPVARPRGLDITFIANAMATSVAPHERLATHATADVALAIVAGLLGTAPALTYRDLLANPYAEDSPLTCYADTHGHEYRIDHARRLVVTMDPDPRPFAAARPIAPEARRSVAELRTIAVAIAARAMPAFADALHRLHPFEQRVGRDVVHFRWEVPMVSTTAAVVPVLHVGLWSDGCPRNFKNTLAYWTELHD